MKHLSGERYVAAAILMIAYAAWSAEAVFAQTPPAGQPTPAAGQPGTLPPAVTAGQGQIAPRTAPDNVQANQATPQRPSEADVAAAASTASPLTGGAQTSSPIEARMIGDPPPLGLPALAFGPRVVIPGVPPVPPIGVSPSRGAFVAPSERGIKIANNENPAPQDRLYFNFNYYDNLNAAANERLGIDVHNIQVYQYTFGLEKTFLDGNASFGMRLPVNNLSTESGTPTYDGNFTDIGNLTMILKYLFYKDQQNNALSGGLALTVPTGPSGFAGADQFSTPNPTVFQPFIGYRLGFNDWFIHGFFAGDFPCDQNDVTMFYSDIGVGYFLLRRPQCSDSILTAVVPTFEVHVNNPLNHRGAFNGADLVGTADVVNLTSGITFEINHRSTFTVGLVVPVTGPKPFDVEALAQVNWSFGRTARSGQPMINNLQ